MATVPFQNFVFTDPVAAQQATTMAQILQAAQAEKDRNMAQLAQEVTRQGTARQNNQANQAMTRAQMEQQASEAEKNRVARAAETDKIISSQEKAAGASKTAKDEFVKETEAFDALAELINTEDPPTDSEFEKLSQGISPERKMRLKLALDQRRRALQALANEAKDLAGYWNGIFQSVKDKDAIKDARERFAKDKRANDLLKSDPNTYKLIPKYSGPRMDAPNPPAGPRVTSINDLKDGLSFRPETGDLRLAESGIANPQPQPAMVPRMGDLRLAESQMQAPQPPDFSMPPPASSGLMQYGMLQRAADNIPQRSGNTQFLSTDSNPIGRMSVIPQSEMMRMADMRTMPNPSIDSLMQYDIMSRAAGLMPNRISAGDFTATDYPPRGRMEVIPQSEILRLQPQYLPPPSPDGLMQYDMLRRSAIPAPRY